MKIISLENLKTFYNNSKKSLGNMTNITYAELKTLRDNSQLVEGQYYRITDFVTTVDQKDAKSAGHRFDIIVLATNSNTLNENALAAKHAEDTYFNNSNLDAWELKYDLDNDKSKYAWADSTNGKGVIYRMIDEFNNDVPYDFKNIQFYRKWDSSKSLWSTISSDNTGIPCYTFSSSGSNSTTSFTDMSLSISNGVYSNVIKEYIISKKQTLNNICFFGAGCDSNSFESDCYNNSFGNYCSSNSFGDGCQHNSFGNSCGSNSFGNYCYNNSFGRACGSNSFGNGCRYNSFGNSYSSNSFGNYCYYNSFGNNCSSNSFGNGCHHNSFRDFCCFNSFGNGCHHNSFRDFCCFNSFGNDCYYNSFRISASETSALKDYIYYNHFDDGCSYNIICNRDTTSSTIRLKNINVNRGVVGTSSSYNMINIDVLNSEQEINVIQVNGIVLIDNSNILSITYESLKTLRDNAKLIPGKQYRIIDYITRTSQENTRSSGHQFDIIVTALDERTLSEEAQAIQNSNEEYFDGSNLSAWKIWYCLDNDTNRFAWAGDEMVDKREYTSYNSSTCTINPELINGNAFITPFNFESCVWVDGNNDGFPDYNVNHDIDELIYEWGYFTDENGDTQLCIYKSNAGLYEEEGQPDYGDKYLYRGVITVDSTEYDYWQKWDEVEKGIDFSGDYVYATTQRIVSNPEAYSVTNKIAGIYEPGKGVIYRMIDEFNNDVPYDFKNIQFARDWSVIAPDSGLSGTVYCYTFSIFLNGFSKDAIANDESIKAKECIESDGEGLFGNNTIKIYQNDAVIRLLNSIVFVTDWSSNSVYHYSNSFGNNCSSNSFGNSCHSNSFGTYCANNSFRNNCTNNSFGSECNNNSFGSECNNNSFGNNCQYIKFTSDSSASTKYNYYMNNHFGDDCQYIVLKGAGDASVSQQLQNYNFARGIQGTSSNYLIIDGVRNLSYETKVAKNSSGELKIYCEADLIA